MPDYVFTMDLDLLEQCSIYVEITNSIPHPEFVMSLPANYLNELALFRQGIAFFSDIKRRDPAMK